MAVYTEREAETSFARLVEEAVAGEEVVVARAGKPLLKIVAVMRADVRGPRVFGQKVLGDLDLPLGCEEDLPLDLWEHLQDDVVGSGNE